MPAADIGDFAGQFQGIHVVAGNAAALAAADDEQMAGIRVGGHVIEAAFAADLPS